jgi:SAM-dependent methyltransferase
MNYPRGDIALGCCNTCGFITNLAFDPGLHTYSPGYESTQAFSPTFNAFHRRLAKDLVERYDLRGKHIIEIGCGQGEFLTLLCELGGNYGFGFDPVYSSKPSESEAKDRIKFIADFYSEKYSSHQADFICCKMTLEHIQLVADFLGTVRRSLGDRSGTTVFFQVPDVTRILRQLAFWDIYYEHCSYFSPASLSRLFRRCGFEVIQLARDYGDQYLMILAKPGKGQTGVTLHQEDDLRVLKEDTTYFTENYPRKLETWRHQLQEIRSQAKLAVIWGAGSKAVAFLTTLNIREEIEYTVDINPYKHNTYLAGTGHKIVAPTFLRKYKPDVVIVMNPIYCKEVARDLAQMGIAAELLTV